MYEALLLCPKYDAELKPFLRIYSWSFGNTEYSFTTITHRSTLTNFGSNYQGQFLGQIELFDLLIGIIINRYLKQYSLWGIVRIRWEYFINKITVVK